MKLSSRHSSRLGGFTLVELTVASSVGLLIAGTTMLLLLESAQENRRGLADASAEEAASNLANKLIQTLRPMSAGQGVIFFNPATNSSGSLLGYQSVIVAAGPPPDYPRQQISFDPSTGKVTYLTNMTSSSSPINLFQTNTSSATRMLSFLPSIKQDGTPDNSLVNVLIEMDDNNSAGRSGSSRSNNPAVIWRTFAVKMRNN